MRSRRFILPHFTKFPPSYRIKTYTQTMYGRKSAAIPFYYSALHSNPIVIIRYTLKRATSCVYNSQKYLRINNIMSPSLVFQISSLFLIFQYLVVYQNFFNKLWQLDFLYRPTCLY